MWGIVILSLVTQFVCVSGPQVTCSMPSVEVGQRATLTCDFGVDMQAEGQKKEVIIQRRTTGDTEDILDCHWDNQGYTCQNFSQRYDYTTDISQHMTVHLLAVNESDVGQYFCQIVGSREQHEPCSFTIKEPSSTETDALPTEPSSTETDALPTDLCTGWKVATGFLVVIFLVQLIFAQWPFVSLKNGYSFYKPIIFSNTIESLVFVIHTMDRLELQFTSPDRKEDAALLLSQAGGGGGHLKEMPEKLAGVIKRLWEDQDMQKAVVPFMDAKANKAAKYFLLNLDRILEPCYVPTKEDVLKTWMKCSDGVKAPFSFKVLQFVTMLWLGASKGHSEDAEKRGLLFHASKPSVQPCSETVVNVGEVPKEEHEPLMEMKKAEEGGKRLSADEEEGQPFLEDKKNGKGEKEPIAMEEMGAKMAMRSKGPCANKFSYFTQDQDEVVDMKKTSEEEKACKMAEERGKRRYQDAEQEQPAPEDKDKGKGEKLSVAVEMGEEDGNQVHLMQ